MIVKGRNVSTATAALAYRIYGHCAPGWGHTYADVAEALGVSWRRVNSVAILMGWSRRFTAVSDGGAGILAEASGGHMTAIGQTSDMLPYRRMAAMAVDEE